MIAVSPSRGDQKDGVLVVEMGWSWLQAEGRRQTKQGVNKH